MLVDMFRLFAAVCFLPFIVALLDPFINKQAENEDFVDVREDISHRDRQKRSAELTYPKSLRFDVTFRTGEKTKLNLTKSSINKNEVSIFTLRDDSIIRQKFQHQNRGTIHFYQDTKNVAAIGIQTVNTKSGLTYALSGTLVVGDTHHTIRSRSVDGLVQHSVSAFDDNITYGTDFLTDEDRTPLYHEPLKGTKAVTNPVYNVELLIVTDFPVYNYWNSSSSKTNLTERDEEVKNNIVEYYSYLVNSIDVVYKSITTEDWTINIAFAGIIIIDSITSFDVTEGIKIDGTNEFNHFVHGETALRRFGIWTEEFASELPNYDHAMLITGYDMYSDDTSNAGLLGIAWLSRTCSRVLYNNYFDNSVMEDNFGGQTALVAAHELGHNLGAQHDGSRNKCSDRDKYNMAPSIGASTTSVRKNVYRFSSCSAAYFDSYIGTLNTNNANCLTTVGPDYDQKWFDEYSDTLAGQTYDANKQCQELSPLGSQSYVCQSLYTDKLPDICTYLYCYIGDNLCQRYFALEGTQCGQGKLCIGGDCVEDTRAKNVSESCVFGDSPFFTQDEMTCDILVPSRVSSCYDSTVSQKCCASCAKANTGRQGCEYGDRIAGCSVSDCTADSYSDCCETCSMITTSPTTTTSTKPTTTMKTSTTPTTTKTSTTPTTTMKTSTTPTTTKTSTTPSTTTTKTTPSTTTTKTRPTKRKTRTPPSPTTTKTTSTTTTTSNTPSTTTTKTAPSTTTSTTPTTTKELGSEYGSGAGHLKLCMSNILIFTIPLILYMIRQ